MELEDFINIGLYFGAAFQLLCILAVIFLPARDGDDMTEAEEQEQASGKSVQQKSGASSSGNSSRKVGLKERKRKK